MRKLADYTLSAKITGNSDGLKKASDRALKSVEDFAEKYQETFKKSESIVKSFQDKFKSAMDPITNAWDKVSSSADSAMGKVSSSVNKIKQPINNVVQHISAATAPMQNAFSKAFKGVESSSQKTAIELEGDVAKIAESYRESAEKGKTSVQRSLSEIAGENGKTVDQVRSDAMKIAAAYKDAGLDASEAINRAYADIGYVAEEKTQKIKTSTKQIGSQSEETSKKVAKIKDGFSEAATGVTQSCEKIASKLKLISDQAQNIGSKLTSSITKPALAAASTLAGITVTKGFTRLTAIDTAKAKLEALGNSAENVTDIMTSANAAVKGTSYGLDEAATTAASAVAAGIQPGEELTRYLSLTADAAAASGRSMSDMGSIFNKVQTSQAAYTEELNQLADSGIPIYQWLGEEAGLSAAEVKAMASEGQISSEMFLGAVEKNIGGAAKIIGENSFSGALSNIWASIGRIGANFLDADGTGQGFFTQLKPLMVEFKDKLGELEEKAKVWGQVFGEAFSGIVEYCRTGKVEVSGFTEQAANIVTKLQPIIDFVKKIVSAFQEMSPKMKGALVGGVVAAGPLITIFGKVAGAVGPIISVVGKMGSLFAGLCSPIGLVVAALALLAGGFVHLMGTDEGFRDGIISSFEDIKNTCSPIITDIGSTLKSFGTSIMPIISKAVQDIAPVIMNLLEALAPALLNIANAILPVILDVISMLVPIISELAVSILPIITELINMAAPIIVDLLNMITPLLTSIMSEILPIIQELLAGIMPIIEQIFTVALNIFSQIMPYISQLIEMITPFISQLMQSLVPLLGTIFAALQKILDPIMKLINQLMPPIITIIQSIMDVVEALLPVVMTVIDSIMAAISPIIDFIAEIIGTIIEIVTPIITFVANVIAEVVACISPIIESITSIFGKVFDIIGGVVGNIKGAFEGFMKFFTNVFSGNWEKAWEGIKTMISNVWGAIWGVIKGFVNMIIDGINSLWSGIYYAVKGIVDSIGGIAGAIGSIFGQDWSFSMPAEPPLIPKLARGTDDFRGGLARINEGGRGELVSLPNGSQVIPHDISVSYAKEAARANRAAAVMIDYDYLINGMVAALGGVNVTHNTVLDSKVVASSTAPLIDRNLGDNAVMEKRFA